MKQIIAHNHTPNAGTVIGTPRDRDIVWRNATTDATRAHEDSSQGHLPRVSWRDHVRRKIEGARCGAPAEVFSTADAWDAVY